MPTESTPTLVTIDLGVTGMTCTSCSGRVERKLNKVPGVTATVNFATEIASVQYDPATVQVSQLIDVVRGAGYDAFELATEPEETTTEDTQNATTAARDAHAEDLKKRLIISAVLSVPVLVLSMVPQLQFDNWQWLSFALIAPVFFYGGKPFHVAALKNLRHGSFTMDTLISLGTSAAFFWSLWALFFGNAGANDMRMAMSFSAHSHHDMDQIYLESVGMVLVFLLLGRWFETRAKGRSSEALRALLDMGAKDASVLIDGIMHRVPIGNLKVGDVFVVRPGEKIATDGIVIGGHSAVDESMLTGESVPVEVTKDSKVTGATLNSSGRLVVRATRVDEDTTLAKMVKLVSDAQTQKAPVQKLADRISQVFVPIVIALSIIILLVHIYVLGNNVTDAFTTAVAVLIIACPCALGLATPTALLVGTGRGAQMGLLIKGPEVLEHTQKITSIVLDKTGTITTGVMSVSDVQPEPGFNEDDVLQLAAAVENASEHPIARAIIRKVSNIPDVTNFESTVGIGVSGTVGGRHVEVGRAESGGDTGATVVAVHVDGELAGLISVMDQPKETSAAAVEKLKSLGLTPILLTGDNQGAAQAAARQVGISEVIAGVMPADKVTKVAELQKFGEVVAMVGDGINDAAALAQADLGLAMGAGTDVAIEASDITLMNDDPRGIVDAIQLSRRTLSTIRGNLFWAFAYNVVLIPVAAVGLLNPMFAGAAMAFSSVFVVSNSLRLRGFRSAF